LRVSRCRLNVVGSGQDFSQDASFRQAKPAGTYFGGMYFVNDSEPYLTIPIGAGAGGGGQ